MRAIRQQNMQAYLIFETDREGEEMVCRPKFQTGNPEVIRQDPFPVCRLFGSHFTPGIPITGESACQPENL